MSSERSEWFCSKCGKYTDPQGLDYYSGMCWNCQDTGGWIQEAAKIEDECGSISARNPDTSKCKCGNPVAPTHTCPYAKEIGDNPDYRCNCCKDCERECLYDI